MSGAVVRFPVDGVRDRAIIAALQPFVLQAMQQHPDADLADIADAAYRLIDPENSSPALVREGCIAALEQIARDHARRQTPMPTLTLRGAALERAAARLGMPLPKAPEQPAPKQPAITSLEARRRRRAAVVAFHERLAAECPATFARPCHGPHAVLMVGIHRQLADRYRDVPIRTREGFLSAYTRHPGYLWLLTNAGADRLDIDGNLAGAVTESEAQHAIERLASRSKRRPGSGLP
jgi:hypothetical protein